MEKKHQQVHSNLLNLVLSPSVEVTFGMDLLKAFQVGDFIDIVLETRIVKRTGVDARFSNAKDGKA